MCLAKTPLLSPFNHGPLGPHTTGDQCWEVYYMIVCNCTMQQWYYLYFFISYTFYSNVTDYDSLYFVIKLQSNVTWKLLPQNSLSDCPITPTTWLWLLYHTPEGCFYSIFLPQHFAFNFSEVANLRAAASSAHRRWECSICAPRLARCSLKPSGRQAFSPAAHGPLSSLGAGDDTHAQQTKCSDHPGFRCPDLGGWLWKITTQWEKECLPCCTRGRRGGPSHCGPPAPYGSRLNVIILKVKTHMMSAQSFVPVLKMSKLQCCTCGRLQELNHSVLNMGSI